MEQAQPDSLKPTDLLVLQAFLNDLRKSAACEPKDYGLYKRWDSRQNLLINQISLLYKFAYKIDPLAKEQREFFVQMQYYKDDLFTYDVHVDFLINAIKQYQAEIESALWLNGLLDKKVTEMTGFELKTLLFSTASEQVNRQEKS